MIDLKTLPTTPGVYLYRNSAGEIIYVGKAINLKKRVSQYFQRDDALGPKTATLVSQIDTVETRTVDSEIQALVLEASLIKKHKPKYNSLLKDDRSYIYICISKDPLPLVFTARFSELNDKDVIYGPFPNSGAVNSILKTLRHIFPYRTVAKHSKKPCFYCHLGMCPGPDPDPALYRQNIGKLKKVLSGKINSLQLQLRREMKLASKIENFEQALTLRNQINAMNYVVSGWSTLRDFYEKVDLPEDNQSAGIQELLTTLNPYFSLGQINRIECYDISQLGHKFFVGSMVVWQNGHIDKSQYRKFKIKNTFGAVTPSRDNAWQANDPLMIKEVLWRRLRHPEWGIPDLIMVDGGKPQVTAANEVVSVSPLTQISIIGLAKKFETIVIKDVHGKSIDWHEINLPQNSRSLNLLKSLRDEAHRFANKYRQELMHQSLELSRV